MCNGFYIQLFGLTITDVAYKELRNKDMKEVVLNVRVNKHYNIIFCDYEKWTFLVVNFT